jgi:hypothetical protein
LLAPGTFGASRGFLYMPPFLGGVALVSAASLFELAGFDLDFSFGVSSFGYSSFGFSSFGSADGVVGVSFGS